MRLREGVTYFPVQAEGVDQAAQSPTVVFSHGENLRCASGDCLREESARIIDGKDDSHGTAAERLRDGIAALWGLLADPELSAVDGEPYDRASAGIVVPIDLGCSER